jgi:transcriptional regulator with XRE-family HTH domain
MRLSYNMPKRDEDQLNPVNLRRRIGLTQRQVAQALDVRQSTVSDWERGVSIPNVPLSKVKLMLQIYQCTLDELIEAFEHSRSGDSAEAN